MDYTEEMRKRLGERGSEEYFAALRLPPVKGLHVNKVKAREDFDINSLGFSVRALGCGGGAYEVTGGSPTAHPYYRAGLYYMQEPSAMYPVAFAPIERGSRVLDMCAAPGGKSSMAAVKLGGSGLIVANDADRSRAAALRENMTVLSYPNVVVTSVRAEELPKVFGCAFDVVIADVPCSGEGMMRKEPQAAFDWSLKNIEACALRQRRILDAADACLKEGGLLIYSTCTFSRAEDEDNALMMTKRGYEEVTFSHPFLAAARVGAGYKFYPHVYRGEGQYFCILRKTARGGEEARLKKLQNAPSSLVSSVRAFMDTDGLIIKRRGDMLFSPALDADIPCLMNGIAIASVESDGRLTPAHGSATALGDRFVSRACLSANDERTAKYLRGEEIPADCPDGWCSVLVDGYPLGAGKATGGVVKNKYPKSLRLR